MTQTPSGEGKTEQTSPGREETDSSSEMLKLARKATARIVTAALEATAESADMERAALARKFPALSSLPAPLRVDPQQIRDFSRGTAYAELIEQYVQGRVEGHLLTRVLEMLSQYLPLLFAR